MDCRKRESYRGRDDIWGDPDCEELCKATTRATVSVAVDMAAIRPGTAARRAFEASFKRDVARLLGGGMPPERVLVTSIRSGSVVVDFSVLPDVKLKQGLPIETTLKQRLRAPGVALGGYMTASSVAVAPPPLPPPGVSMGAVAPGGVVVQSDDSDSGLAIAAVVMGGLVLMAAILAVAFVRTRQQKAVQATVISVSGGPSGESGPIPQANLAATEPQWGGAVAGTIVGLPIGAQPIGQLGTGTEHSGLFGGGGGGGAAGQAAYPPVRD